MGQKNKSSEKPNCCRGFRSREEGSLPEKRQGEVLFKRTRRFGSEKCRERKELGVSMTKKTIRQGPNILGWKERPDGILKPDFKVKSALRLCLPTGVIGLNETEFLYSVKHCRSV